jgi:FdhD protein
VTASVLEVDIDRVNGAMVSRETDLLAVEEPLEIRLGSRSFAITMRTPGHDLELAVGFLFSEGVIRDAGQIRTLHSLEDDSNIVMVELADGVQQPDRQIERNHLVTSACGVCGKSSLDALTSNACPALSADCLKIAATTIYQLAGHLREAQTVFESTGGLHAAAVFNDAGELLSLREDVGRHNAVDKLIGSAVLKGETPLKDSIMLVSGRASFELVQKALMAGIPVLAAVGAPSSLAHATAERGGMTLIGFLRDSRFNVYTHGDRISS